VLVDKEMQAAMKADGKVWDCSQNVRGVKYFSVVMTNSHQQQLEHLESTGQADVYRDDFFSIIKLSDTSPPSLLAEPEFKLYREHIDQIFRDPAPVEEILPEYLATMPEVEEEIIQVWTPIQMEMYF